MGSTQDRNLRAAKDFYAAGPAASDEERRAMFAAHFVWHVPGDHALSGPYAEDRYFTVMPQRMQPLDEWSFTVDHLGANEDLVVAVGRVAGQRLGRGIDAVAGHVLRFDDDGRIVEAWGWCSRQDELDAFFA